MAQVFKRVSVVGLGYVGLPMAAVLASRGIEVIGVDTDENAVELINRGSIHIREPDLDIMVNGAVSGGTLRATTMVEPAEAFIIAVPTYFDENHKPDLSHVEAAARSVAQVLTPGDLLLLESTSPVGATEQMAAWAAEERTDLTFPHQAGEDADIRVAHSPERVLPGRVLLELVDNERVIGGLTPRCAERAAELYAMFVRGACRLTDARTAEMIKLAENSYRDVNIAFANELSNICDGLGVDVWDVIAMANQHPRVDILNPGPGVGGHCISVDPWFIVDSAPELARLIRTARETNDAQPAHVARQIRDAAGPTPRIACLGLAYKADIDDLRESPAIEVVALLAGDVGTEVRVVEPNIDVLPEQLRGLPAACLAPLDETLEWADVVVLLVDHREFKALPEERLKGKTVIDTRGIWRL